MTQARDILSSIYNFAVSVRLSGKPKGIHTPVETVCGHLIRSMPDPRTPDDIERRCVISIGNIADSRDGEARSATIPRKSFDTVVENVFWTELEPHFIKYTSQMSLDSIFYFPSIATSEDRAMFKEWFFNARYDFKIAMVHFYYLIEALAHTTNMTPTSFNWLHGIEGELVAIVHEQEARDKMSNIILKLITDAAPRDVRAMKLIPLTVNESRNIEDIRYRVWREIYVQNTVGYLRRYISNNFGTYADWALIYDIDEAMFMNPHVLEKFRGSSLISALRSKNTEAKVDDADILKDDTDILLQFSAKNVELSGVALVSLSMQTSRPLRMFKNASPSQISELMFDWLYALLILHVHVGVIHSDLHSGNLQFRSYTTTPDINIDGNVYVHRTGFFGLVLDFSRCIINPYFEQARGLSVSSPETIAQEQSCLLERFYLSLYPNSPHKELATKLIASDFEAAFRALSLLDVIKLARSLMQFFPSSEVREVIREIHDKCEKIMIDMLREGARDAPFPLRKFVVDHFKLSPAKSDLRYTLIFNTSSIPPPVEISQSHITLLDMILRS